MIIIHALYQLKPGTRDAFEKEVAELDVIGKTNQESGNLDYNYYHPLGDENAIFIVERWKDAESFEGHLKAPHVAALQDVKKKYLENMVPNKYEVVD